LPATGGPFDALFFAPPNDKLSSRGR
jgi:hypothetical protein